MAIVSEAEAIQARNANVAAMMLHPRVCAHLRAQFLIYCPRVLRFSKLMWHRTAKDDLHLAGTSRLYLDRDTDIEAATNPVISSFDNTGVSITEP